MTWLYFVLPYKKMTALSIVNPLNGTLSDNILLRFNDAILAANTIY